MKFVKVMAFSAIAVLLSLMNAPANSQVAPGGLGGGQQSCRNQFINCMWSGSPIAHCTAQQRDCERALLIIRPLAATDAAGLPVDPLAEPRALQFKALLRSSGATTVAFGSTYCRKMADRCAAGNASACDLFDRHCGGGD